MGNTELPSLFQVVTWPAPGQATGEPHNRFRDGSSAFEALALPGVSGSDMLGASKGKARYEFQDVAGGVCGGALLVRTWGGAGFRYGDALSGSR
jgi:hypothetical protein